MVVKRLKPILVEAVARGYLIGSGWKDYQATGSVCGIKLPAGLQQASQLPEPIFTPAAKAEFGMHDENVDFAHVVKEVGQEMAERIRDVTLCCTPRPRALPRPRASSSPTPSSSSAWTTTARST